MEKKFLRMNTLSNSSNSTSSSNSRSNSTDGTESTHTQTGLVSPKPMRNSITVGNLANIHRWPAKSFANKSHKPFRKCQSFVHLSKISSDRVHSSLINHRHGSTANNDHLLHKSSSSPSAIYTAIKQEHRYFVYRIFSRCKVVLCFVDLCCFSFHCFLPLTTCAEKRAREKERKKWRTIKRSKPFGCVHGYAKI